MGLFVNTNVASLNASRNLFNSSEALDVSFQRLSSGFRINSARDDAAGLQISDRLTSQIQGLDQAVRNANDGISVAQTIEGALQETTTSLQRIRVLAVQSQNGINSSADRAALQLEVSALQEEINRIAQTTQFAGVDLLDGTYSTIGGTRAELGAVQNRFQSTIRNLSNISENVSGARSRIRDTDFAIETAELTRNQIVQQAGITVLGQANQQPQAALSLLGG
jgi:flagellin